MNELKVASTDFDKIELISKRNPNIAQMFEEAKMEHIFDNKGNILDKEQPEFLSKCLKHLVNMYE